MIGKKKKPTHLIPAADFQKLSPFTFLEEPSKIASWLSKTLETRPSTASIAPRSLTGDTVDQTSHENRSIDVDEGPAAIAGAAVPAAEKEGLKMYVYIRFRRMCRIEP